MLRFVIVQSCSLVFFLAFSTCLAKPGPWVMRISCGARVNVHSPPTNTLWYKDFAYTGGIPTNASLTSYVAPPLSTLRYFPLSEGPNNCYNIKRVPKGHYSVRVFYALVAHHDPDPNSDNEPLFDISVEGTQIYSLQSGWSSHDDRVFTEAQVFLTDGTASICFHSTGHGDPAILSIEILQVDDRSYFFGPEWGQGVILRTATRFSCGNGKSKFDVDYSGDRWGGDRFWSRMTTFGQGSDKAISTENSIKKASNAPNFYPESLYQTALVSTDTQPDLAYTMDVDPNKNYSVWLHFAEIDVSITGVGKRIFDILINGDVEFEAVDITKMSGGRYTALVLNTTVAVNGRTLTITLRPKEGNHAIVNAIEVFEVITAESKTLLDEVRALQTLKSALGLPLRFGWNGDPCVPQQHPWTGADCQFDRTISKWVIDGLGLDNQGLRGFLPNDMSKFHHLQSINLSTNSIHGAIPLSIGSITSLEVLDLSYNFFNGSIPESIGQLTSLRRLNLNGNSLSGRVPAALGGRLLHGASFNFTDNAGLCGIPGLRACGPHLSAGAKIGIAFGASVAFLFMVICSMCWWKRRQNILRAQQIAARGAPYAKARTHNAHDIQMTRHYNHGHARTAAENGPSLLS
ncbi:receptor-like protein 4 [Ricinus communis]|uniref:Serine-threonine protein kinase, plant-type, putative n=1 Tax=Ricinus communis TaxID=3988 RepID=B9RBB1_RICCO|nr:receptor-like protein 4 [Ricinus communis]EEF50832.1 serine-threonine protein kinase, plant-type, putative [Ricinus communis]|eukprot:XP_002509445.1 receptor-like protein 4 [Ricinus communis]